MTTIAERLEARRGVAPGFDFLRLLLALAVVGWHMPPLVGLGTWHDDAPVLWLAGYAILMAFFGLSGFLIAGSALRLPLRAFLVNRGLRIFPALLVEIVLSALVLGPIFTTLTLAGYFTSGGTWHYFTNIAGIINYRLPGVFTDHPLPIVNMTLWTVPMEIICYAIMSVFIVGRLLHRRAVVLCVGLGMIGLGLLFQALGLRLETRGDFGTLGAVAHVLFVGNGSRLFAAFVLGIAAYLYRDCIPYSPALMVLVVGWCVGVSLMPAPATPVANLLAGPAILYLTVCIGVTDIALPSLLRRHDYSYGIYLYGFPMQQVVIAVAPAGTGAVMLFLATLPAIFLFSAFSWHLIERPILRQRKRFSFISKVRLAEVTPLAKPAARGSAFGGPVMAAGPAADRQP